MARGSDDHRPAIRLSLCEQVAFLQIVEKETTRYGRRLLDAWAHPGAGSLHAERALTETLKLLWRTTAG